jgi:hypothetical protein
VGAEQTDTTLGKMRQTEVENTDSDGTRPPTALGFPAQTEQLN